MRIGKTGVELYEHVEMQLRQKTALVIWHFRPPTHNGSAPLLDLEGNAGI